MSEYTLSVVQLVPDAYREQANAIAAAYRYGDGNLSVELRHADGSTWWGCHAWWIPEALDAAMQPPADVPGAAEVLARVVTSVMHTSGMTPSGLEMAAVDHWRAALSANELSVPEVEES